jgi:hypothetical protein
VFVVLLQEPKEDPLHDQCKKSDERVLGAIFKDGRPAEREAAMMEARVRFDGSLQSRVPLPPALHGQGLEEDVLQRTWELTWRAGPGGFDPARGPALAYLEGHARNARRDVCQEHAPPGMRRRPGTDATGTPVAWLPAVSIEAAATVTGSEVDASPGLTVAAALAIEDAGFEQALDRLVVEQLEQNAAGSHPLVGDLIAWMCRDRGLGEAAAELGVSRHVARRALDQYALSVAA